MIFYILNRNHLIKFYSLSSLQECLIELLQDMCGDEAVPKIFKGDKLTITLNAQKVNIDLLSLVSYFLLVRGGNMMNVYSE